MHNPNFNRMQMHTVLETQMKKGSSQSAFGAVVVHLDGGLSDLKTKT